MFLPDSILFIVSFCNGGHLSPLWAQCLAQPIGHTYLNESFISSREKLKAKIRETSKVISREKTLPASPTFFFSRMQSAKNYGSNFCPFWWNGRSIVFIGLVFPQFGKYVLARLSLFALLCDMKNRARLARSLARSKLHQSAFNSPSSLTHRRKL